MLSVAVALFPGYAFVIFVLYFLRISALSQLLHSLTAYSDRNAFN